MSENLTIREDGKVEMMYVGETPWHRLGKKMDKSCTVLEAITAAGADWHVSNEPIYRKGADGKFVEISEYGRAAVRKDNDFTLGVVGPNTHALQNADAFQTFEPIIQNGVATIESAGTLGGGKQIWVMARMGNPMEIIKGDYVEKFLLLSNSHDGTRAVRVGFTPIRVVCANTLTAAVKSKDSSLIRIRHSKNVKRDMQDVFDVVSQANEVFEATAEQLKLLTRKTINQNDLRKYIKDVFNMEKIDSELPKQSLTKIADVLAIVGKNNLAEIRMKEFEEARRESVKNAADALLASLEEGAEAGTGNDNPQVRGTVWGAYNAITEHLTHQAGRKEETRLASLWFGPNAEVNKRALKLGLELVG